MAKKCIVNFIGEFTDMRLKSLEVSSVLKNSELLKDRALKIENCGTCIGLSPLENTENYGVTAANFCRQRLCPTCQRRRSLRTFSAISKVYELAKKGNFQFLHVVLTVPNCSGKELDKTCDFLYKKSSLLFRKSDDAHTRAACRSDSEILKLRSNIKNAFKGVFRVLEVTYNEKLSIDHPFAFHPHLHCLVAVKKSYFTSRSYVSHENLQKVWARLVGVDNVQLFIGKVTDQCASIAEVAKYAVKPFKGEITAEVLEILHSALFNRRLVQSFGIFKDWLREVGENDLESVLDDEKAKPSVWLNWEGGTFTLEML